MLFFPGRFVQNLNFRILPLWPKILFFKTKPSPSTVDKPNLVGSNLDEFSTLVSLHNLSQTALLSVLKNFVQNNLTGQPDGRPPVDLVGQQSASPPSSTSAMLASHQPWRCWPTAAAML